MTNNRNYKEISKEELINKFEEAGSIGFPLSLLLQELAIGESFTNFFHPEKVSHYECKDAYKKGKLSSIRKIYKAILEKAVLGDLDSIKELINNGKYNQYNSLFHSHKEEE
jgi:hypothetical protein